MFLNFPRQLGPKHQPGNFSMPTFRENSTPDDTTLISFTSSVLAGMARAFAALQVDTRTAELSHAEWLGLLLDREITERRESAAQG
jgi:hypothetical protein